MASHARAHNTSLPTTRDAAFSLGNNSNANSGGGTLLQRRDLWLLCLTAFIAMMLSKGGTLLPGMSADDYFLALGAPPGGATFSMVAQGRGLNALLAIAIHATGASLANIYFFTFFLASAAVSLAIAGSITLLKESQTNQLHHHAAAAFAATYPYLTSYFLFRMSLVSHAFIYATLFGTLWLFAAHRKAWHQVACVILLAACGHISQIIFVLFAISAGCWSVSKYCHERKRGVEISQAAGYIISFIVILFFATGLYFISSFIARSVLHVSATSDYSPHLSGGISGTIYTTCKLAFEALLSGESILPLWLKICILIIITIAIACCLARNFFQGIFCIILFTFGFLISVSPMALSWGGFVPRTFSPIGLCIALVFCLACNGAKLGHARILAVAMAIPTASFCFIGASLFYQQMELTRWDQHTAAAIYYRITQQEPENTPILVVASWPIHGQPLSYDAPGINESAFLHPWAYPGLFAAATGEKLDVIGSRERSLCDGLPSWPNPGSLKRLESGKILVCMVR